MENIIIYAPYAVFVVIFLIQLNIFARTSDVKAIEAKLMTYAMEHFVTQNTYNLNHKLYSLRIASRLRSLQCDFRLRRLHLDFTHVR